MIIEKEARHPIKTAPVRATEKTGPKGANVVWQRLFGGVQGDAAFNAAHPEPLAVSAA